METSDTTWEAHFYVAENTTVNGASITDIDNLIRYRNVRVSMACGEGSRFLRTALDGRVKKQSIFTSDTIGDVFSATIPWWDEAMSIINLFSRLTDSGKNVELGGDAIELQTPNVTAVGVDVPYSKCEFYGDSYDSSQANYLNITENSHYLITQGILTCTLSGSVESVTTTGSIQFLWDVFLNSTLEDMATGESSTFTKTYIVTH